MKRYLSILGVFMLSLVSCSHKADAFNVETILNEERTLTEITSTQVINYFKAEESFILYIGNVTCETCAKVSTYLVNSEILKPYKLLACYPIGPSAIYLIENLPDLFDEIVTPQMMVVQNGKAILRTNNDRQMCSAKFENVLNDYSGDFNNFTFTSESGYQKLKILVNSGEKLYKNTIFFYYSSLSVEQLKAKKLCIDDYLVANKKSRTAIVTLDIELLDNVTKDNLIRDGLYDYTASCFSINEKENSINYLGPDGINQVHNLLDKYCKD